MQFLKLLVKCAAVIAVVVAALLFLVQNDIQVPLDLVVVQFQPQRLSFWILLAFVFGSVFGFLVTGLPLMLERYKGRQVRRKLDKIVKGEGSKSGSAR
jgi:uncharacterized membrane protein YciS (DUF1049 family)